MRPLALLLLAIALLVGQIDALKTPVLRVSRRAAIAGLGSLPSAARAAEFTGYKTRDYDGGPSTAPGNAEPKVTECPEGQRLSPDGFGGKVCKGKVKPVLERVVDGVVGEDRPPPAERPAPKAAVTAPRKSVGETTSSSKPLTFEDLLANSIVNKESYLGRELSDVEKADLAVKLKALMGQ